MMSDEKRALDKKYVRRILSARRSGNIAVLEMRQQ